MRKIIIIAELSTRISVIIILVAIFVLRCTGIRIRGSSSYTYDPRNPGSGYRLSCDHDNSVNITGATWTRNNEPVENGLVLENGRLVLNQNTIGIKDPQNFEGLYRCHSGGGTSDPVAFFVVPRRSNVNTTVQRLLEGKDVAINCSLHFGSLRKNWTVTWTVENKNGVALPTNGYHIQIDPSFCLVINNATIDYEGARFQCRADRPSYSEDSQRITLNLFYDAEATMLPDDPVIVDEPDGVVTFKIKAYPPPITIEFCYNGTCSDSRVRGRIQVTIDHNNDETMHTASFIVYGMKEEDNGNVTLRLRQTEIDIFSHTVMLFLPYKIKVRLENTISSDQFLLQIILSAAIYFDYEIEFVDMNDAMVGFVDGKKGEITFSHTLTVQESTDMMARFKIGEIVGPNSDPLTLRVKMTEAAADSSSNDTYTVVLISVLCVTIVLLIICVIVLILKWRRKKGATIDGDSIDGVEDDQQNKAQPTIQYIPEQNQIKYQPQSISHGTLS